MSAKEVNELIVQAARRAARETDDKPEPALTGEVLWPVEVKIGKGLEGAISNTTNISYYTDSVKAEYVPIDKERT